MNNERKMQLYIEKMNSISGFSLRYSDFKFGTQPIVDETIDLGALHEKPYRMYYGNYSYIVEEFVNEAKNLDGTYNQSLNTKVKKEEKIDESVIKEVEQLIYKNFEQLFGISARQTEKEYDSGGGTTLTIRIKSIRIYINGVNISSNADKEFFKKFVNELKNVVIKDEN